MEGDNNRPYKVKDINRTICKGIVGATLEEVKAKSAERFEKPDLPTIHLDSDGTEIDDEEYFQTLEPNTELVAVFSDEHWIDPTHYVTITAHRSSDTTDSAAANVRRANLQKIVNELRNNLHNVSVLSETDLEMITNMDPNSIADIVGKEFLVDQLKDVTGRLAYDEGAIIDAAELLVEFLDARGMNKISSKTENNDELSGHRQPSTSVHSIQPSSSGLQLSNAHIMHSIEVSTSINSNDDENSNVVVVGQPLSHDMSAVHSTDKEDI